MLLELAKMQSTYVLFQSLWKKFHKHHKNMEKCRSHYHRSHSLSQLGTRCKIGSIRAYLPKAINDNFWIQDC